MDGLKDLQKEIEEVFLRDHKWFKSEDITPFFSTMIKVISQQPRYAKFDQTHQWLDRLKEFYHKFLIIQPKRSVFGGGDSS
jgi:hypothetical protein